MFRLNDLILMVFVFSSMTAGILFPKVAEVFHPFLLYLLMCHLFLSLLRIKAGTIWQSMRESFPTVLFLSFLKLIALPILVYFMFLVVYPPYAVAALLLTGVSTGVVAPFISNLLGANSTLVLLMVITTSPLVPFTLPFLIKLLLSRQAEISLLAMVNNLSLVIFVPILAVETLRRLSPRLLAAITGRQFHLSLITVALINLGVFSRYAEFLLRNPSTILASTAVAIALSGLYLIFGIFFLRKRNVQDRLAGAISIGNMNNVLVIVFSSRFFGPLEPTVAAMYMIPFFGLILPLRSYSHWLNKSPKGG